jgi:hypothetical protein
MSQFDARTSEVRVLQEELREQKAVVEAQKASEQERVHELLQQQGLQRQTHSAIEAQLDLSKAELAGEKLEHERCRRQLHEVSAEAKAHTEQLQRQTQALAAFKAEKMATDATAENRERAREREVENEVRRAKAEVVVAQAEAKRGGAWRGEAEAMLAENVVTIERLQRQLEQQRQAARQQKLHHQQQLRLFTSQGATEAASRKGGDSKGGDDDDADDTFTKLVPAPPPRPVYASPCSPDEPRNNGYVNPAVANDSFLSTFLPDPSITSDSSGSNLELTPGTAAATKSKGLQNQIEELHSKIMSRLHQPFDPNQVLAMSPSS